MNREELSDALGKINLSYIEEAEDVSALRQVKRRTAEAFLLAAAALVLLTGLSVYGMYRMRRERLQNVWEQIILQQPAYAALKADAELTILVSYGEADPAECCFRIVEGTDAGNRSVNASALPGKLTEDEVRAAISHYRPSARRMIVRRLYDGECRGVSRIYAELTSENELSGCLAMLSRLNNEAPLSAVYALPKTGN